MIATTVTVYIFNRCQEDVEEKMLGERSCDDDPNSKACTSYKQNENKYPSLCKSYVKEGLRQQRSEQLNKSAK